jgi:hypothetical protein
MRSINRNVRTELSNAGQVTSTPNINLVPHWDAFITQHFAGFENRGRTWVKERIAKDTEVALSENIKKYKAMLSQRRKQEQGPGSQAHASAQQGKNTQLTATLDRKNRNVADEERKIVTLRGQRDALTKQIAATKAPAKKAALQKDKKAVEAKYTVAKQAAHQKRKEVGLAQRAIHELYSSSIAAIVENLLRDRKQLQNYRQAIPTLTMPRP